MNDNNQFAVQRRECLAQTAGNPLWYHYRQSGVDTNGGDLSECVDLSQQPFEIVVSRGQRITAAQNDLGDAAVPADLPQSFLPLLLARRVGRVVKVSPEAITAVYCTMRRGSKQDTTPVFLQQSLCLIETSFLQGIFTERGIHLVLQLARPDLPQQRVVPVARLHAPRKWSGHLKGKPVQSGLGQQAIGARVAVELENFG